MTALERAVRFVAGSHFCDHAGEHPHKGCECCCGLCFSFWHFNIWRYEQAEKIIGEPK